LVRVQPKEEHPTYDNNGFECYQNPYPTSFGGCGDSPFCKQYVYAFHYDVEVGLDTVERTQIYIGGRI